MTDDWDIFSGAPQYQRKPHPWSQGDPDANYMRAQAREPTNGEISLLVKARVALANATLELAKAKRIVGADQDYQVAAAEAVVTAAQQRIANLIEKGEE